MRPIIGAARVLLFLLDRPRAVLRVGTAALALGVVVVGVRAMSSETLATPPSVDSVAPDKEPAFCKNLDPNDVYLWGEVGAEGPNAVRAFASVKDATSYCTLPSRRTFFPRLRSSDRRLAYMLHLNNGGGELGQLYLAGGEPALIPTPNCATRFSWFEFAGTRPHYGCEVKDPYDKEWYPVFYRDDGALIGARRGLDSAIGDPSEETILGIAREGLSIIDTRDATIIVKVTGIEGYPTLARAAPKGFIVVSIAETERRLWKVDRAGKATLAGKYAPMPSAGPSLPLKLATTGELYEYIRDVHEGDSRTNQVVVRTLKESRVIHSDGPLKKSGVPYVRLDTKTTYGAGVFTAR